MKASFPLPFLLSVFCSTCTSLSETPNTSPQSPTPSDQTKAFEIPEGQGSIWMPLSWTLTLNEVRMQGTSLGDALSGLRFRDAKLVLKNIKDGSESQWPLYLDPIGNTGTSLALSIEENSRTVFLPKSLSLPSGDYALDHFKGVYIDVASEKPQEIKLPIPNPLVAAQGTSEPLRIHVEAGELAVVGRIAFESAFAINKGRISSQMRAEYLEGQRIPALALQRDFGWSAAELVRLAHKATGAVPALRLSLPAAEGPAPLGKGTLGFALSLPCKENMTIKFVWRRAEGTEDFVSAASTPQKTDCADKLSEKQSENLSVWAVSLPVGSWKLVSTEILSSPPSGSNSVMSLSKIPSLQMPSPELEKYFQMKETTDLLSASMDGEQNLEQPLILKIAPKEPSSPQKFYYLGTFAITENRSRSTNKGKAWNFLLKKQFTTTELNTAFETKSIWNPYTQGEITAEKKEGKVEAVLRISADAKKTAFLNGSVAEIRKELTESYARCIQHSEKSNPLLLANAVLKFRVKQKERKGTVDSLVFLPQEQSELGALETCFRSEFDKFSLQKPSPATFDAEMQLYAK